MGRELEGYRDMLERMDEKFPNREILRGEDICAFTGWSRNTVLRRLGNVRGGMAKTVLARKLLLCTGG